MSTTEALVAPDAATEIPASELAETPEVAAPENSAEAPADESPKPEEDPRDKTVKSLTRRVDRVTAARYQAEARAQQASTEAEQLRHELAQYRQGNEPAPRQEDPVVIAKQLNAIEKVAEKSQSIVQDGAAKFGKDTFAKALSIVFEEAGQLMVPIAPGSPYAVPTALGAAILEADDPAALLHYLGSNPDAAAELHGLTATQAARRIARIEIEMGKAKEPKQSNAPKPITSLKSTTKDEGGLSDSLSTEEWIKRRNAQARGR